MSASTQTDQDLSRREEMSVSSAAMSAAPWSAATVTGGIVAAGDLGLHIIGQPCHPENLLQVGVWLRALDFGGFDGLKEFHVPEVVLELVRKLVCQHKG